MVQQPALQDPSAKQAFLVGRQLEEPAERAPRATSSCSACPAASTDTTYHLLGKIKYLRRSRFSFVEQIRKGEFGAER
jgi:hypothetical protein